MRIEVGLMILVRLQGMKIVQSVTNPVHGSGRSMVVPPSRTRGVIGRLVTEANTTPWLGAPTGTIRRQKGRRRLLIGLGAIHCRLTHHTKSHGIGSDLSDAHLSLLVPASSILAKAAVVHGLELGS